MSSVKKDSSPYQEESFAGKVAINVVIFGIIATIILIFASVLADERIEVVSDAYCGESIAGYATERLNDLQKSPNPFKNQVSTIPNGVNIGPGKPGSGQPSLYINIPGGKSAPTTAMVTMGESVAYTDSPEIIALIGRANGSPVRINACMVKRRVLYTMFGFSTGIRDSINPGIVSFTVPSVQ